MRIQYEFYYKNYGVFLSKYQTTVICTLKKKYKHDSSTTIYLKKDNTFIILLRWYDSSLSDLRCIFKIFQPKYRYNDKNDDKI